MSSTNPISTAQATNTSPKIIGIYGVSGCGKNYLSNALKVELATEVLFFDGSDELSKLLVDNGGLEAFKKMDGSTQKDVRTRAIEGIHEECLRSGKAGIVTGHYMFWKRDGKHETIMTEADKKVYTHMLYLMTTPAKVVEQVAGDTRQRTQFDANEIGEWQHQEEEELCSTCYENNILFTTIQQNSTGRTAQVIRNAIAYDETTNATHVNADLLNVFPPASLKDVKTMLVLDADKTLAPQDASTLYWQLQGTTNPLKPLFDSKGYSYFAFRQVAWFYEQNYRYDLDLHISLCEKASESIKLDAQMLDLLKEAHAHASLGVVIVTCGLGLVWEMVLQKLGLEIPIISSDYLSDSFVITPQAKADIVARLQEDHGLFVCAIGDSEVDLPMLKQANEAVLAVGAETSRSQSFLSKLQSAIDHEGLRVCQALLAQKPIPRLDTKKTPVVDIDENFLGRLQKHSFKIHDATKKTASMLLASSTRDVNVHGLALQQAHENAGYYLAVEYISDILHLESFDMTSVEGNSIQGHCLLNEKKTCIVSLIRGGDPFARGVFRAFPNAAYYHAKSPTDLTPKYVAGMTSIILADWVINTGGSIVEFVRHIFGELNWKGRIVMVAGVVQEHAIGKNGVSGAIQKKVGGMGEMDLVTLRVSERMYTGHGGTDTGHRLFHITHLDSPKRPILVSRSIS